MSTLAIRKIGDPVLKQKCKPVEKIDAKVKKLIVDMLDTLYAAPGVGLAANQVGVPLQLFVMDLQIERKKQPFVLINPSLKEAKGKLYEEEGCLSLPGIHAKVKRNKLVKMEAINHEGMPIVIEGEGLLARVLQHEYDHLQGKTFVDHLSFWQKARIKAEIKKRKKEGSW